MIFVEQVPRNVLSKIRKLNWYRHGVYRDNILFRSSYAFCIGHEWFKKEGMEKGISNLILLGDQVYAVDEEFKGLNDIMYKRLGVGFLRNYIRDYREDNEKVINLAKETSKKDFVKCSDKELKKDLGNFFETTKNLFHWLWSMEFLNPALDKYTKEKIKEWKASWSDEKINEFINLISFIQKKLPFQKEMEEMLKDDLDIKELHSKYAWINMNTWDGRPFTLEEYKKRIKIMLEGRQKLENGVKESEEKGKEAQKAISEIEEKEIKELLILIQELIFLKTERIDFFTRSWNFMLPFIDEVCKRLRIKYEDFLKLTMGEILKSLEKGKVVVDFNLRMKYVVVRLGDSVYYFYGKAFDEIEKALLKEDYSKIEELKGTVACKGIVKGPVRVLMNDRELSKVKKGDILVCNLTNPNYNPVFERIKGMVTDEGGLLCHSAIMAREFKIPCIIGTKIATKVFKNGDYVEVDAEKGVVRKIR